MDFSLLQIESRRFGLRNVLALKTRWPYYAVMVADPVLRFGWIVAVFTHDRQHPTLFSFLVALLEIVRRGIWAIFRVENEHCANVSQYKASRDVPLPCRIEPLMGRASAEGDESVVKCVNMDDEAAEDDTENERVVDCYGKETGYDAASESDRGTDGGGSLAFDV